MKYLFSLVVLMILITACSDESATENTTAPNLIIKLNFDPNQQRLDNLGQPAVIPAGNAAQTPNIQKMSANYIEFAQDMFTQLGAGEVVYVGPETNAGGAQAIDFQQAILAGQGDTFLTVPLSQISAGTYEWVRVSLSYQEGNIDFLAQDGNEYTGTLASFVGYNNYITAFNLNNSSITVNDDKLQGFWAFEALGFSSQGQAPPGATTVPNPLFATSPVPQGSCIVTGEFANGFTITGNETQDVTVTLSFSINNSFEWTEVNADGKYEPGAGEQVVDMGLRGVVPSASN